MLCCSETWGQKENEMSITRRSKIVLLRAICGVKAGRLCLRKEDVPDRARWRDQEKKFAGMRLTSLGE